MYRTVLCSHQPCKTVPVCSYSQSVLSNSHDGYLMLVLHSALLLNSFIGCVSFYYSLGFSRYVVIKPANRDCLIVLTSLIIFLFVWLIAWIQY